MGTESAPRIVIVNNLTAKAVAVTVVLPQQFVLTTAPCTSLPASGSCSFSLAFLPLVQGDSPGTLSAQAVPADGSAGFAGIGYVEGYGLGSGKLTVTGALIVNGVYNFGQVTSGQSLSQTFTLANFNPAGSPPITVRRISSNPPFLSSTNCSTALAVGQTCSVTVTFAPSNQVAAGTPGSTTQNQGALIVESDASSGPSIVDLIGQAAPQTLNSSANSSTLATYSLSQGSLSFPQTVVGDVSASQTLTLTNTGNVALSVTGAAATSPDFTVQNTCATVAPSASCTITVMATPQPSNGSGNLRVASLEISSTAAASLDFVSLVTTSSNSPLSLAPNSLSFGTVLLGNSVSLPVTLTNTGSSPINFNSITATGDYATSGSCPSPGQMLAANSSCTVQVTFTPGATGTRTGTLNIATSVSTNPLAVPLTGLGAQSTLTVAPSSLAFGSITVGASANLTVALTNTGGIPITGLAVTANGDFAVTIPCTSTILAAGSSCTAQVTFTPSQTGARTATLTVVSSDAASPATIPLSGTGVQGGSFSLTVNGGTSATASVVSGQPATFQLLATPLAGFSGTVALTCAPLNAGQYATCSLLPSTLNLAGGAQSSQVTLNTITETPALKLFRADGRTLKGFFACLLVPGLWTLWSGRRDLRRRLPLLVALLLAGASVAAVGCGSSPSPTDMLYTPPGGYQYQVTAVATGGISITHTVTLNLTVTAR